MGVLMRGVKMPKNCEECNFKGECHNYWDKFREAYTRPSWCPLVEIADTPEVGEDAISREYMLEQLRKAEEENGGIFETDSEKIRIVFEHAPSVIPQPKESEGEWLFEECPDGYYHSECSICKHWFIEDAFLKPYKYCPNCRAKMKGTKK